MRNYLPISLFIFIGLAQQALCQQEVRGIVTSTEDSLPLPGVNVVVKGTTTGTITDVNGFYRITVPGVNPVLLFSFIGMQPREVDVTGMTLVDVTLAPDAIQLEQIVVTALGIKRDNKALGYSVTGVSADEIAKSRERSVLNSLQGKIAGVDISSSSGAPGSSTRIMLRGVSSLGGSNQPLFIIDGVPVNNSFSGSTSINGGTDFGNNMNDINPDDIESVSFIKGAGGATLYGSRASNGVVVITTKKGALSGERPTEVSFASSASFEEPLRLVKYQNHFGQGIFGNMVSHENMSWGPAFDSKLRYWGHEVDNSLRVKAYRALPNNVLEFFETGRNFNNSLSFSGGSEKSTVFLSFSNIMHDGIFPTNADSYNRNTIALRGSTKVSDKTEVSLSINYINKKNKAVSSGQGEQSVYNQVMQTPRDISLLELEDIESKWNNLDNYYSFYTVNPYFILKNNGSNNNEDRVFGSVELSHHIVPGLSAFFRAGGDVSNSHRKLWRAIIAPQGNNQFASVFETGLVATSSSNQLQLNSDLFLQYTKAIGNFQFSALAGQNINERSLGANSIQVQRLTIPGFYHLDNTSETPVVDEFYSKRRLIGLYSTIDLSFKSLLFLTATARNDWSSTLPTGDYSFFYPGLNVSFVFSELLGRKIAETLAFGKLRASWTRVGNDAPAYRVYNSFVKAFHSDGFGFLRYPLPNGVNAFQESNILGNDKLKPELTTELELGTDLRLYGNRLGIDFTWYNKTTTNLIWPAPLAFSTGFARKTMNLGKLTNKGVELLVTVIPIKRGSFAWETSVNFAHNRNKLVELTDGLDKVILNALAVDGGQQIYFVGKPGRPVGIFEGRTAMRDELGRIVTDNQGIPRAAEDLIEYGDREYRFISGISNTFTYRSFTLSGTFDIKQGGIMYSRTKDVSIWAGTVPVTLYNSREPFIVPNSVYEVGRDVENNPIYAENTIPLDALHLLDYWGRGGTEIDGASLIDKSYVKLREVTLSYDVPQKLLARSGIKACQLSLVGRNLLLWTPVGQTYIDPELTTFGTDLNGDFGEYGAQPTVRSLTVGLRITL